MKIRIQTKLAITFSLIFVTCFMIVGVVSYYYSQKILKNNILHHVEHISNDITCELDNFFKERIISIKTSATSIYIRTRVKKLNEYGNNNKIIEEQVSSRLKQLIKNDPYISEFFVMNSKGKVIASTDKNKIGIDKSGHSYFNSELARVTDVYISKTLGTPTMVAHAPLNEEDTEMFIGVIAARIKIKSINRAIKKYITSDTEEAYVINSNKLFIAGAQVESIPVFGRKIISKGINDCISGKETVSGIHLNYKGEPVLGVYKYLADNSWVCVVEAETQGAFKPIYSLRNWFLGVGVLVSLLIISITVIFAKHISRPLLELQAASDEIARGNLDVFVDVKTGDEMELLSKSFNRMAKDLKKSRQTLEKYGETLEHKVREKTKELQKKVEELEQFNKLSVGRELKMVKLKEDVQNLLKKLGKD